MDIKVLQVIRKILQNTNEIAKIAKHGKEYFFKYRDITFSISRAAPASTEVAIYSESPPPMDNFIFYIYPNWTGDVKQLSMMSAQGEVDESDMASYSAATDEEYVTLVDLWSVVRDKYMNLDEVFRKVLDT